MVGIFLKRIGPGMLIGAFIALVGVIVVLGVRMVRSLERYMKLLDGRVKTARGRLVEIAHAAYHTLQVELLSPHHAIHVEVRGIHHVMQLDVTRHHELWLRLSGTDLLVGLMFLLAVSSWTSARAISILLFVKTGR
jgi:hypothetical protein